MPLYPNEGEIARAVLGADRAREWPAKAAVLERKGLPKIDPFYGGRFWPAVQKFLYVDAGLDADADGEATIPASGRIRVLPFAPDGESDFDGEKEKASAGQWPDRRIRRARA